MILAVKLGFTEFLVYIGETSRDLTTRLNEHKAHGRRGECDKCAIIKHSTDLDHVIFWQKAEIIAPERL